MMGDRFRFFINRIGERLWVRPLVLCILSIIGVFLARVVDNTNLGQFVPEIALDSIETLLSTMASSMLVIATFAVASMLSAYASASSAATPRSFTLIVADDVSQNALSTFIGAFIFSLVSLIAIKNDFFSEAGRFTIFALTIFVFAIVVLMFVRWTDSIARLGRLGTTIRKVESAAAEALKRRHRNPRLGGVPVLSDQAYPEAIFSERIGYVQRVDVASLQQFAEEFDIRIRVAALPGAFSTPGRPLAFWNPESTNKKKIDPGPIEQAFLIGDHRIFDEDPRFGLIVLAEIASRALSPAVNDPGTAIDTIGTLVRLFALWHTHPEAENKAAMSFDRVEVPELSLSDMFDDAFSPIARDGADIIEVMVRLHKAFESLALMGDSRMRELAARHARMALARGENSLTLPQDLEILKESAQFARSK